MYTRIYAPLRKAVFHSLMELNAAIRVALEVHNSQLLQGRNYSRRLQFEEVERPVLAPLPVLLYEFKKQHQATVINIITVSRIASLAKRSNYYTRDHQ
jgi:hypothetical protein